MKSLIKLFVIFVPFAAFSQNWELMNSYDRYNYREAVSPLITNVIFADSFKTAGTDTIYYLNAPGREAGPDNSRTYGSDTLLLNVAQFFQKQIRRRVDGTYIFYPDTSDNIFPDDTFIIESSAGLGGTWLYDTTANITATVSKIYASTLFGISDSFKQINLITGDSIVISRSFGIIGFPSDSAGIAGNKKLYYSLQGISTRGIGDSVLTFRSFYNFNPGDVFMYHSANNIEDCKWTYEKLTVIGKQLSGNSVTYTMRRVESDSDLVGCYQLFNSSRTDTVLVTYTDSAGHFANSFPGQVVSGFYTPGIARLFPWIVLQGQNPNDLSTDIYRTDQVFKVPCKITSRNFIDTISAAFAPEEIWFDPICVICQGLGDTHFSGGGSAFGDFDLIGYIKNGVHAGEVLDDREITAVTEIGAYAPVINIFPNPSSGSWQLTVNDELTGSALEVYNLTGQLVFKSTIRNRQSEINIPGIASGIYELRIITEHGTVARKVVNL
jgi:hypothetical protein